MKKLLFIFIALLSVTAVSYAAFPVHTDSSTQTSIVDNNAPTAPAPEIDWVLAAVCFFFGYLGIHRFMIGDTTNGILMLLTAGGCGIWALIDFIRILSGKMSR